MSHQLGPKEDMTQAKEVIDDWIISVQKAHPLTSEDYLRTLASSVIIRAKVVANSERLDFFKLCGFMMEWTRDRLIFGGYKPEQLIGFLPKNAHDIGLAKIEHDSDALKKYKKGMN